MYMRAAQSPLMKRGPCQDLQAKIFDAGNYANFVSSFIWRKGSTDSGRLTDQQREKTKTFDGDD